MPLKYLESLPDDLPPIRLIERRPNLSKEEFIEEYAKKNRHVSSPSPIE